MAAGITAAVAMAPMVAIVVAATAVACPHATASQLKIGGAMDHPCDLSPARQT